MAAHTFERGLGAGDLDQLHDQQHRYPGQLHASPGDKDNSEGVGEDYAAEGRRYYITLDILRVRPVSEVVEC